MIVTDAGRVRWTRQRFARDGIAGRVDEACERSPSDVRSTNTKCTRGRGCSGHPAFPTPSLGGRFINGSGAWRGGVVNACLDVIASAAKQSISPRKGRMDCFAALAMTIYN